MYRLMPGLSLTRLVMLVAGCVAALLLMGFVRQSIAEQRIERRAEQIQDEIRQLEAEKAQLAGRIAYYQSDEYVERTAREKLNLVRPGDVAIVIVPADRPASSDTAQRAAPSRSGYWPRWWAWLTGNAAR
jgi:cell division protein FtsB